MYINIYVLGVHVRLLKNPQLNDEKKSFILFYSINIIPQWTWSNAYQ